MRSVRRTTSNLVVAVAVISLVACGSAGYEEQPVSLAEVEAALEEAVDQGVPGIALEMLGPGGERFLGRGVASLEDDRQIARHDRSRIASTTKTFTATLVMQLVEQGELELESTVGELLPGLLAHGGAITVRDLLQHTSGLPDYVDDGGFLGRAAAGERIGHREALSFVAEEPLDFEPGSEYRYSDSDNLVLGLMLEELAGQPFEELLEARIIGPLGLDSTQLAKRPGPLPAPRLDGYQFDPEGESTNRPENVTALPLDPEAAWASGALVSTSPNVAAFFRAVLRGEVLAATTLSAMMSTVPGAGSPRGPGENDAGLGIYRYELDCGVVWGHTGSWPGYRTLGAASADGEAAVAMLVNATELPEEAERAVLQAQEAAICHVLTNDAS